jgi:hypothetical protein
VIYSARAFMHYWSGSYAKDSKHLINDEVEMGNATKLLEKKTVPETRGVLTVANVLAGECEEHDRIMKRKSPQGLQCDAVA